jgi:LysR family glycine cleavage system transcriptional activator
MRRRLPPLNSLRAFEVVSRHESFRAAAEELHVTAAAVIQQVRALEDHLGRKLLRRRSRGYSLTADAVAGLQHLRDGFEQLSSAVEAMTSSGQRILTVSAVPSLSAEWLVPRLYRLREQYPDLEVLLHPSEELVDLEHSRVDLGIRYGSGSYPGLISGVEATKGLRFSDGALVIQAAVSGQGVALGSKALALEHLAAGRLVRPFRLSLVTDFAYYVVCAKTRADEPDLVAFRRWLIAEAKREPRPRRA